MAVLSTSYDVESSVRGTLTSTISPTQTTGIKINYSLTVTSGVLVLDPDTSVEEYISFGGISVSGSVTTLSDVTRNLTKTANTFTGTGTGYQHNGGVCVIKMANYHALYNKKANLDRANTFTENQTISGTKKIFLNDSDSYIYDDGTDIHLKSSAQADVALVTLANASGVNDKVKISVADTTESYLDNKVTAGDGLSKSITSPAGNEVLDLALDLATNGGLEISGGKVQVKVDPAGNLSLGASGVALSSSPTGVNPTVSLPAGEAVNGTTTPQAVYISDGAGGRTLGRFYKADADDTTNMAVRAMGFVKVNASVVGTSYNVIVDGIVDGFTGLSPGKVYYLSNTAGAITVTPQTPCLVPVGIAISTTQLKVDFGLKTLLLTWTFASSSSDTTIDATFNLGFQAEFLICTYSNPDGPAAAGNAGMGWWNAAAGATAGHGFMGETAAGVLNALTLTDRIARLRGDDATDSFTDVSILSFTDTTITIRRVMDDATSNAPGGAFNFTIIGR